jgi:hypothetical protein
VLLHRPYIQGFSGGSADAFEDLDVATNRLAHISQQTCLENAIRVAVILNEHQKYYDPRRFCLTVLQHAGTAATTLIARVRRTYEPSERQSLLHHLECLTEVLSAMSPTFQPAERMSNLLNEVLVEAGVVFRQPNMLTGPCSDEEAVLGPSRSPEELSPGRANQGQLHDAFSNRLTTSRTQAYGAGKEANHSANQLAQSLPEVHASAFTVDHKPESFSVSQGSILPQAFAVDMPFDESNLNFIYHAPTTHGSDRFFSGSIFAPLDSPEDWSEMLREFGSNG